MKRWPVWERRIRSAIAAAAITVDRANSVWNQHNITGDLVMDIKAAFPRVSGKRPIDAMNANRTDGDLIRCTKSFLSDRTAAMVIEGNVLQSHPVEAGVPQGSPVPPILFAIHSAGLMNWVHEIIQVDESF